MLINEITTPRNTKAKKIFESVVYASATDFCHESPRDYTHFIRNGITSEEGSIFATVNEESNFVTKLPKTEIWFKLPPKTDVIPDMRYESYKELVMKHPEIDGADVSIDTDHIPLRWITAIITISNQGKHYHTLPS